MNKSANQSQLNKLNYLYLAPSNLADLAILGSVMRAIGKGMKIQLVSNEKHKGDLIKIKSMLKDKDSIKDSESGDIEISFLQNPTKNQLKKAKPKINARLNHHMVGSDIFDTDFDLISKFESGNFKASGAIAITGNGKGKTTTALGMALNEMMTGQKVAIIQWFKEKKAGHLTWAISEHSFSEKLINPELIRFEATGLGFFGSPTFDRISEYQAHRSEAYQGLRIAQEIISSRDYSLVVLDELIDTVPEIAQNINSPLIDLADLKKFFSSILDQTHTKIVVTGRRVTPDWSEFIGQSIVISEIKHPYKTHRIGAIAGLDY